MQHELILLYLLVSGASALTYCGPNTVPTPCGNSCEKTCGQLTPKYCSNVCQKGRCVCAEGYIRRDENGPCIPKKWCELVAEEWDYLPGNTVKPPAKPKVGSIWVDPS